MSIDINSVANFYNNVKRFYEPLLYLPFNRGRQLVANEVNLNAYRVIEIGCNQGQLAQILNTKVNYLGIDVASECIKKATKTVTHDSNIDFAILDGENSKLAGSSFDTVILLYLLSVTPEPKKVLEESLRLLKPGGKLLVVNHFSSNSQVKKFDAFLRKTFYTGVNFYFPFSLINQTKGFNIVKQKKVNFFWTYLELKKT